MLFGGRGVHVGSQRCHINSAATPVSLPPYPQRSTSALRSRSCSWGGRGPASSRGSSACATQHAVANVNDTDEQLPSGRAGRSPAAPIAAGPTDSPPEYSGIDSKLHNRLFMHLFRQALVQKLGEDAPEPGFDGIITLTRRLSHRFSDPRDSQTLVRTILVSLFPPGLLPAFKVMFARPFPAFSQWLNALVTAQACQWLMGPSEVSDVELDDGSRIKSQGVKVERCRVLEQSGCASVCVNCCKLPTQEFFAKEMGLDLRMTPNYEDFSCQFNFGQKPLPPEKDEALLSPCFQQCPTKQRHGSKPICDGLTT